jgi:hypothetical protein
MRQQHASSLLLLVVLLRQTLNSLAEFRRSGPIASRRALKGAADAAKRNDSQTDCAIFCHAARSEGMIEASGDTDIPFADDDISSAVWCIYHNGRRRRAVPLLGVGKKFRNELGAGSLHLCIADPFWTNDGSIDLSRSRRYRKLEDDSLSMANDRFLQQQQSVTRQGVKRLLAVRVIADGSDEPIESLADIEGAIFGTGEKAVPASIVNQYIWISHGQLQYTPLQNSNVPNNGVLEVTMPSLMGVSVQGEFTELLLNKTRDILLGEDSELTLEDAVDNIIFCLPDGGLFKNSTEWTAFTYLFEPYSYFQKQRCTRLSVGALEYY